MLVERICECDGPTVFTKSCPKCGNHNGKLMSKNPAAVQLGSLGGKASAKKLTKKQRKERATKASHSRKIAKH